MRTSRSFQRAALCCVLGASFVAAQSDEPREPAGKPVESPADGAARRLVDEFIGVMPMDPRSLRDPEQRRRIAPDALPVLRRVRAFVEAHPACFLARRRHEFTVYAIVLGDDALRRAVEARADDDPRARLLLRAAAVLTAADDAARAAAVAACTEALDARAVDAALREGDQHASCAVQCLAAAADLTAQEARALAERAPSPALKRRLLGVAARAARDPRLLLGTRFSIAGAGVDGEVISTASLRGKVVLVDFWATWCRPCVEAMPALARLRDAHPDELAIVGVSNDRDEGALRHFLEQHPEYDWPQLFEPGTTWHHAATAYGVDRIPRVFLIDRQGILRSVDAGTGLADLVRRYVDE